MSFVKRRIEVDEEALDGNAWLDRNAPLGYKKSMDPVTEPTTFGWNSEVCDRFAHSAQCLGSPNLVNAAARMYRYPKNGSLVAGAGAIDIVQSRVPEARRFMLSSMRVMTSGINGGTGLARAKALDEQCDALLLDAQQTYEAAASELAEKLGAAVASYATLDARRTALEAQLASYRDEFGSSANRLPSEARVRLANDTQAQLAALTRQIDRSYAKVLELRRAKVTRMRAHFDFIDRARAECSAEKQRMLERAEAAVDDLEAAASFIQQSECSALGHLHTQEDTD